MIINFSHTLKRAKLARTSAIALALSLGGVGGLYVPPANAAGGQSYASIQSPGETPRNQDVVLPFGKSTIVELPQNVMDVIISSPDVVESIVHTSHRVMLIGRKPGQASVHMYGHDGQELISLDVRVERDLGGLRDLINEHVPGNEIEIQAINDNILLSGPVANQITTDRVTELALAWLNETTGGGNTDARVINLMSSQGKEQVMLKVRIVEMQRSVTKQMGIEFDAVVNAGATTFNLFSQSSLATGAGFSADAQWNNTTGGDLRSLGGAIQALERVGLVRTKAEPTLVAITGETANFQSGGEFPLLTGVFIDDQGRVQREFEFKPYGVSLGFTPTVLSEGLISLNVSTEVSEPTTEGSFETGGVSSDILGLRVRKANTVVELPAGESLVIAGLIREEGRQSVDGTPGLKDVPGLGALFRNRDDLVSQTELVITVTPYLVSGAHPDEISTPLDGFAPANDREALFLGRMNKVYARPGATAQGRTLKGPYGHVVD